MPADFGHESGYTLDNLYSVVRNILNEKDETKHRKYEAIERKLRPRLRPRPPDLIALQS